MTLGVTPLRGLAVESFSPTAVIVIGAFSIPHHPGVRQ